MGHRDVIEEGFDVPHEVDAIFLDLPKPWEVVPHVRRRLKRAGKLCTFSPCIEQVQKTCEALKATGAFANIRTLEVLQRPLTVQQRTMVSFDFTPQSEVDAATVQNETELETMEAESVEDNGMLTGNKRKLDNEEVKKNLMKPVKRDQCKFRSIFPPPTMPGHTGYLTFATMILQPESTQELTAE